MKLLLDTHIWLWSVLEAARLSPNVAKELENVENELWLSPISLWELLMLWQKGRVLPGEELDAWISRAMRALPIREASVTYEVAREIGRLKLPQRDPADNFLVATAKVFELTLVTADQNLIKLREISILPNR
jgi:PIN domain nuclease of toxin-antitoxin system